VGAATHQIVCTKITKKTPKTLFKSNVFRFEKVSEAFFVERKVKKHDILNEKNWSEVYSF
jgi:hypothetical protein